MAAALKETPGQGNYAGAVGNYPGGTGVSPVRDRRDAGPTGVLGARPSLAGLLLCLALVTAGCHHCNSLWCAKETPPTGHVVQIATTWEGSVRFTHDVANGGASLPGLAGRLYLFGEPASQPLVADGMLLIDFYDDRPLEAGQTPVRIEQYQIDKDSLKRLMRKDTIGWGYTIFLPWTSYRPEQTKVHLFVRYIPERGAPLYTTTPTIVISDINRPNISVASQTVIPGLPQQQQQQLQPQQPQQLQQPRQLQQPPPQLPPNVHPGMTAPPAQPARK